HRDALELDQRDPERAALPAAQDEHLVHAIVLGRHPDDLHFLADTQRRDGPFGDAAGLKREVHGAFEVVIPAHRLFFGPVGVDDDLHLDPVLAILVARAFSPLTPPGSFDPWHSTASFQPPSRPGRCLPSILTHDVGQAQAPNRRVVTPRHWLTGIAGG